MHNICASGCEITGLRRTYAVHGFSAVLKSLSVGQLQRLQDLLTEVTYRDGEYVIRQGDQSENLYIIAEGRVRITRKEVSIFFMVHAQIRRNFRCLPDHACRLWMGRVQRML